ncbi:hypothetical protein EG329_010294 [Mollisiaceae sp. DMI_Dod_QoI]|nr:hypothetical protein EG329_010294 [Helotiales sp. DMI_Dod_QoI]
MGNTSSNPRKQQYSRNSRTQLPRETVKLRGAARQQTTRGVPANLDSPLDTVRTDQATLLPQPTRLQRDVEPSRELLKYSRTSPESRIPQSGPPLRLPLDGGFSTLHRNGFRRRGRARGTDRYADGSDWDVLDLLTPPGESILKTEYDRTMAARQTEYETFSKSKQREQEKNPRTDPLGSLPLGPVSDERQSGGVRRDRADPSNPPENIPQAHEFALRPRNQRYPRLTQAQPSNWDTQFELPGGVEPRIHLPQHLDQVSNGPARWDFRHSEAPYGLEVRITRELQPISDYRNTTPGKSFLKTDHDRTMAARQKDFDTLSSGEQRKQAKWARQYIKLTGLCPGEAKWLREKSLGGFICTTNQHLVTDALIAEGKGGMLRRGNRFITPTTTTWEGPFYGTCRGSSSLPRRIFR